MTTIKLQDLDIEQLATFKKETDLEVQNLTYSLSALNGAVAKFKQNMKNIDEVTSSTDDNVLVPLTASLYVPGKVKNKTKFLVDVGVDYFIEKDAEDAKAFYNKKIEKLGQDSVKLKEIIKTKSDMLRSIEQVLQTKLQQSQAQNQA